MQTAPPQNSPHISNNRYNHSLTFHSASPVSSSQPLIPDQSVQSTHLPSFRDSNSLYHSNTPLTPRSDYNFSRPGLNRSSLLVPLLRNPDLDRSHAQSPSPLRDTYGTSDGYRTSPESNQYGLTGVFNSGSERRYGAQVEGAGAERQAFGGDWPAI